MLTLVDMAHFTSRVRNESQPVLLACLDRPAPEDSQVRPLRALARERRDLEVWVLDRDSLQEFKGRFQVRGTPTYLLFQNGQERDRLLGLAETTELEAFVHHALGRRRSGREDEDAG
jgi:thioredoxin-like negative regulator of GroEL